MKKKSQVVLMLDDLRNQDAKKRLFSVQSLKQIAASLGPLRTRTQLLQYLMQFVDDEQNIVLELLDQLKDFRTQLGGEQHQKNLIPLLICFCRTDEKSQTEKAVQMMESILRKNKEMIVDVVKKLWKSEMNSTRECIGYLISRLIQLVPQNQSQLLQIYSGMIFCETPQYKIIGSRHLSRLLQAIKNKQQVGKMLEIIYNDNDDLPKVHALEALVSYYSVNANLSMSKFKNLLALNNWRINAKICDIIPLALKIFSKSNFKATFQSSLLKFLSSNQPQLRTKSCSILKSLASVMAEDQAKKNLIPCIKKLSTDQVDYVQLALSQNIVSLIEVVSPALVSEQILPIILSFIKSNKLAVGVLENFQILMKKISPEIIEDKILTPLFIQLNTDDWKIKCQLIDLLTSVISYSLFLNDKLTTILVHLVQDKIHAVRDKAAQLIINIICKQSPQWCDSMLIPKIQSLKDSASYIERQILLDIVDVHLFFIQKSSEKVSQKTLTENYRQIVVVSLGDKVPNVKVKALNLLKSNKKIYDKMFQKMIEKLKTDPDIEVKRLAVEFNK